MIRWQLLELFLQERHLPPQRENFLLLIREGLIESLDSIILKGQLALNLAKGGFQVVDFFGHGGSGICARPTG